MGSGESAYIAGAGLIGRLTALRLLEFGWRVTLYDPDDKAGRSSAAYTGAGMLAPYCELESAEHLVSELGCRAVAEWRMILRRLHTPVALSDSGTLVVAHAADAQDLERLRRRAAGHCEPVGARRIRELEPELTAFSRGVFFPDEGHIDNRQLLRALAAALERHPNLRWVHDDSAGADGEMRIDCRGLGARVDDPELRGVRGELLHVRAPEVSLNRAVRLMHPRYPLYVVPRADHVFVVGATQIESDNMGGITVRSALELLSALYSLHTGFAEAEVLESSVNCRPAYPDNLPRITVRGRDIRVNGLFRHGFLLAPRISDVVVRMALGGRLGEDEARIVRIVQ